MILSRRSMLMAGGCTAAVLLGGCAGLPKFIVNAVLPTAPPYPFGDPVQVRAEAQLISDRLERFIVAWLDGKGPAELPAALIPQGADQLPRNLRLIPASEIDARDQWTIRPAHEIDWNDSPGLYPDPHCTYLMAVPVFLPFGATIEVEGSFPHARFFSIQVTPPFDPRYYYYGTSFGAPEVPIVDVDIAPLSGHTNPFEVGADRNARRRDYRVELDMMMGYGPEVEPAYRAPNYRAPGNRRKGSGIVYQGPMGLPEYKLGHGRGLWDFGAIWVRYYVPDKGTGPLAGVPLPRLTCRLRDGRRFGMVADIDAKNADTNRSAPIRRSDPVEASWNLPGPPIVWSRELDILHTGLVGIFQATGKTSPADKAQGRALIRGLTAHGTDVPSPGPWQCSASRVPYISYLSGGASLGSDQVLVLSGRLPRHPSTRQGAAKMQDGRVRYMSLTSYVVADFLGGGVIGQPVTSVMDEDIVTDADGRYLLCYSRRNERPVNAAPENGVTWIDWGPVGTANFNLRWMTVEGGWKDKRITPDEARIPYAKASWFEETYDQSLVGLNGRSSVMGDYLPTFHYLSKSDFERLGPQPRRDQLRVWNG